MQIFQNKVNTLKEDADHFENTTYQGTSFVQV